MNQNLTGQITFASGKTGDYDIWTFDLASGDLCQLTTGNDWNDKPHWSPDGQWITFISNRTGFPEVYKVPARGGQAIQLTKLDRWCDSPRFSPDGTKIAFISNEAGNNDVWIMNADGENRQQITQHDGSDSWVDWTPDGKGLLWSSDRDENDADVWYWDLASGQKIQLTDERGQDFNPVASPCGTLVAFVSDRQVETNTDKPYSDRDKDIWMMSADGSNAVRLTENQGCDFCICWSPDGRYLMYTSSTDRSQCHLRIMDVSTVVDAFAAGDFERIEKAAEKIRSEKLAIDRTQLKAEINAVRYTTFVTAILPEKWVESCYPPGFFGQERFPHWTVAAGSSNQQKQNEFQSSQPS